MLDFTAALARLLRDGTLRDRFADNPVEALGELPPLEAGDRQALLQLDPNELEVQATILLRKRFDEVHHVLPRTCAELGTTAWPLFQEYARTYWPDGKTDVWADAGVFGEYLVRDHGKILSPAERNRVAFAVGSQRIGLRLVPRLSGGTQFGPAVQIFWRRGKEWREFAVFLGV